MGPHRKPRVTGTTHPLPFAALSAEDFERLTLWLAQREGFERAAHLGQVGSDQGRDVEAWRDGRRFVFQCKRVQSFTAAQGRAEIAKLQALPPDRRPDEVVFVLYRGLQPKTCEAIQKAWGDEATCLFWMGTELDALVKRHPEIVREFFQIEGEPQRIVWLGQTRAPSQTFVGRKDDLLALDTKLKHSGKVAVQAAVTGLAGIGKTELALHYAHYHASPIQYPGGVIWLDASTDLAGQWARLAPSLGIVAGSVDPRTIEPAVLSKLAGRERMLFVLDNAESWQALKGHLPIGGTAHACLVTTRERDFGGAQFGEPLDIGVLGAPEARELLYKTMGRRAEENPEEVERLLAGLGGHALALEIAGTYLKRHPKVPAEEMAQGARRALGKRDLDPVSYGKTFREMIDELLARLASDEPEAARLFPLLGLFGEAPAPTALLAELCEAVGAGDFDPTFESLIDLHLVDRVGTEEWTSHRLVRSHAREALKPRHRQSHRARQAYFTGLAQRLSRLNGSDVVAFRKLIPHIDSTAIVADRSFEKAELLAVASSVAWVQTYYRNGARWLRQAITIYEKFPQIADSHIASLESGLAASLLHSGDMKGADREIRRCLQRGVRTLEPNHRLMGLFRSNHALILCSIGTDEALSEALPEINWALSIDLCNLGPDHVKISVDRSLLAQIHARLGNFNLAIAEAEAALEIALKAEGPNGDTTVGRRTILAEILLAKGDLKAAMQQVTEAIKNTPAIDSEGDLFLARNRSLLATILLQADEIDAARREATEAMRLAKFEPGRSLLQESIIETWRAWLAGTANRPKLKAPVFRPRPD